MLSVLNGCCLWDSAFRCSRAESVSRSCSPACSAVRAHARVHTLAQTPPLTMANTSQVPADRVQQLHRRTEGEVHRQGPDMPRKSPSRPPRGDDRWAPGGRAGAQCDLHHPHGGGRGDPLASVRSELTSRSLPTSRWEEKITFSHQSL